MYNKQATFSDIVISQLETFATQCEVLMNENISSFYQITLLTQF